MSHFSFSILEFSTNFCPALIYSTRLLDTMEDYDSDSIRFAQKIHKIVPFLEEVEQLKKVTKDIVINRGSIDDHLQLNIKRSKQQRYYKEKKTKLYNW